MLDCIYWILLERRASKKDKRDLRSRDLYSHAHKALLIIGVDADRDLRSTVERGLTSMEDGLCSVLTVHLTKVHCLLPGREYEGEHGL